MSTTEAVRSAVDSPFHVPAARVAKITAALDISHEQLAVALLDLLSEHVVTPVSHFQAMAVGVAASGAMYGGVNVELAGTPLANSVHAEQCMVSNVHAHGERELSHVYTAPAPCGHCRQFFRECRGSDTMRITICSKDPLTVQHRSPFLDILPHSFSPRDLGNDRFLLDRAARTVRVPPEHRSRAPDRVLAAGEATAAGAYSPHTCSPSAVVLQLAGGADDAGDGELVCGAYLENAAYNPSLPPLQYALARLAATGRRDWSQVSHVYLFERAGHHVQQRAWTEASLAACIPAAVFITVPIEIVE